MRLFSLKTVLGCFLMAGMLFVMRAQVPGQEKPFENDKAPVPEVAETVPEATPLYDATELEKLDSKIQTSGGTDTESYLARAHLNEAKKNRHRAIHDIEQFERLRGKDEESHALRGQAKMQIGDFAGALQDFQLGALNGNPPGHRHYWYALSLHYTGKSPLALAELVQAIKKEPENSGYFDLMGIIFRAQGNRAAALINHDLAIKVSENGYSFADRACTHYAFGNYKAAKQDFEKATQLGTADAYAYRYYAYFLATCTDENYRDAKRALQLAGVALEHDPHDGFALHAKACALALLGEYEVAVGAGLRARENREFANDPELGGGVEGKAYLAAWKQGKPLFRTPDKEK